MKKNVAGAWLAVLLLSLNGCTKRPNSAQSQATTSLGETGSPAVPTAEQKASFNLGLPELAIDEHLACLVIRPKRLRQFPSIERELAREFKGLDVRSMTQLAIFLAQPRTPDIGYSDLTLAIDFNKDTAATKVIREFVDLQEVAHGDHTYLQDPVPAGRCFFQPNPRSLIIASESRLKKILDGESPGALAQPLQNVNREFDVFGYGEVAAVRPEVDRLLETIRAGDVSIQYIPFLDFPQHMDSVRLAIDLDSEPVLSFRFACKEDGSSRDDLIRLSKGCTSALRLLAGQLIDDVRRDFSEDELRATYQFLRSVANNLHCREYDDHIDIVLARSTKPFP